MDEKTHLLPPPNGAPPSSRPSGEPQIVYVYEEDAWRPSTCAWITHFFLRITLIFTVFYLLFSIDFRSAFPGPTRPPPTPNPSISKVPLEAHIMSKCPDAKDCLKKLIVPTMEEVADKVDFKLSYIASVGKDDTDISCMHGPSECLGNIIELCAAELYPDPKMSLGFTMCMTENYQNIPQKDLVKGCALEYGIEFQKLNECASKDDGAYGSELLRKSAERTAAANVTYSCTVRLNDDIRCIRDGGQWKNCPGGSKVQDLVNDINKLTA